MLLLHGLLRVRRLMLHREPQDARRIYSRNISTNTHTQHHRHTPLESILSTTTYLDGEENATKKNHLGRSKKLLVTPPSRMSVPYTASTIYF